ncbi:CrcB family protein [Nocardioides sp. ChNu-153]|uniref:fluoride efflux transporter FluC n=1 Tax=Nocardioides sp. ChNu-153 TaxID=2779364 RepID=UPI0026509871|nr:CrcB family protein [Nocardioides sp. ChNu-153]MDN7122164.1 CrcB family protein [Nocardioides sp. ChNu-153]
MSPALFVLVAVAGGVGAALRFLVDDAVRRRTGGARPLGTLVVNLTGAFALGLVVGLAGRGSLGDGSGGGDLVAVLGTGLLGGYTTFSTAAVEVVRLVEERRWGYAAVHGPGMLVAGVGLAALGWWLGA